MPDYALLDLVAERYLGQGLGLECEGREYDACAIRVACNHEGDRDARNGFMKHWLKTYGTLIGLDNKCRRTISHRVVKFYDLKKEKIPDDPEGRIDVILKEYRELNRTIRGKPNENIHTRKFLSLTSKALWCKYPEIIPIYDSRVRRAIRRIAHPNDDVQTCRRTSNLQPCQSEIDCINYENFIRIYFQLYDRFRQDYFPLCDTVLQKISDPSLVPDCPHVIRVFDKILWLYGAMANDNRHRHAVYDDWETPPP